VSLSTIFYHLISENCIIINVGALWCLDSFEPIVELLLSWPCNFDSGLGIVDVCRYLTRYLMGPRRKLDLLCREAKDEGTMPKS
jgi:hypothetical protein